MADNQCGTVYKRGLSGGQKRRTTVGIELMSQPKVGRVGLALLACTYTAPLAFVLGRAHLGTGYHGSHQRHQSAARYGRELGWAAERVAVHPPTQQRDPQLL